MGKKSKQATKQQNEKTPQSTIHIIQKNKRAFFEYEILDKYECGIMLFGPEVKSIRANKVQFADSFAKIKNDELFVHNLHVSNYKFHTGDPIDPVRIRKLLLHHEELKKLKRQVDEKGRTLVPLSLYLKNGLVKFELGVGRGKKLHDKKETIKQRTAERDAAREVRAIYKDK